MTDVQELEAADDRRRREQDEARRLVDGTLFPPLMRVLLRRRAAAARCGAPTASAGRRWAATSGTISVEDAECRLTQKSRGATSRPTEGSRSMLMAKPEYTAVTITTTGARPGSGWSAAAPSAGRPAGARR